jgi:RHS repeat-associated protein
VSGNGLTVTYTSYNKTATITRGTSSIAFQHDPEHQRYSQTGGSGVTLYFAAMGVLAERFGQLTGPQRWTNLPVVGGRLIGIKVENADQTTLTRYFHTDHLGSIAVITNEVGVVTQRLSYDAWGLRRQPDGTPDPAGAITSETTRGFTGQEHLAEVGLIHMNGRVYDPLVARFGSPDPMTEAPYSTQGWNRYSYVGNSPVNFTDPSGYCFMGCFWQPMFRLLGDVFRQAPILGAILQITAGAICGPPCAALASAFVTGVTSGDLGKALRAGITAFLTAEAFTVVGNLTESLGLEGAPLGGHAPLEFLSEAHLFNIAAHALVGCASAVAGGGRCGPGALAAAAGSFAGPMIGQMFPNPRGNVGDLFGGTVVSAVVGGVASVAGGGKFANGAVTAAFGYLFNQLAPDDARRIGSSAGVRSKSTGAELDPPSGEQLREFKVPPGTDAQFGTVDVETGEDYSGPLGDFRAMEGPRNSVFKLPPGDFVDTSKGTIEWYFNPKTKQEYYWTPKSGG